MTKLTPANWEPPYPAFVADIPDPYLNFTQIAIQSTESESPSDELSELKNLVSDAPGLLHYEHVYHQDEEDFRNDILLTYWADPEAPQRWRSDQATVEFIERERSGDDGLWIESFSSPASHFETSYSRGTAEFGLSCHHALREDPVHAYYGAMRDRIPAAEDGGLAGTVSRLNRDRQPDSRGKHLAVDLPGNLCFIRTVQGWLACTDEERE